MRRMIKMTFEQAAQQVIYRDKNNSPIKFINAYLRLIGKKYELTSVKEVITKIEGNFEKAKSYFVPSLSCYLNHEIEKMLKTQNKDKK